MVSASLALGAGDWPCLSAGSSGTSATTAFAETLPDTVRDTVILPGLRISSPSVVSVGADHVSVTFAPLRVACRSLTGLGIPTDGGNGAPGVPQPVIASSVRQNRKSETRIGK